LHKRYLKSTFFVLRFWSAPVDFVKFSLLLWGEMWIRRDPVLYVFNFLAYCSAIINLGFSVQYWTLFTLDLIQVGKKSDFSSITRKVLLFSRISIAIAIVVGAASYWAVIGSDNVDVQLALTRVFGFIAAFFSVVMTWTDFVYVMVIDRQLQRHIKDFPQQESAKTFRKARKRVCTLTVLFQ
jgi:hypothetical protein